LSSCLVTVDHRFHRLSIKKRSVRGRSWGVGAPAYI